MPSPDDPPLNAARYVVDRLAHDRGEQTPTEAADARAPQRARTSPPTSADRAMFVENSIQQAIRRGDFDDLPGAGKPLANLGGVHDPDWWIRRKIEREGLSGLGPPALTLRVESRELEQRLDALTREHDVREYLDDFNARVIEARRQLLGGPPVVTPVRDTDAEVAAWRARRESWLRSAREADASRSPAPHGSRRRRLFRKRDPR